MTWAMLEQGYRIGYAEDAIVFTDAPTTFRQFYQQRKRWSRGLIEALQTAPEPALQAAACRPCSSGGTACSCRST